MNETLNRLLEEGFEINIGLHGGVAGYFAEIRKDCSCEGFCDCSCDSCGHQWVDWHGAGHGFTLKEALKNAELIARGQKPETEYEPKDFGIKNKDDEGYLIRRCVKCKELFFRCRCEKDEIAHAILCDNHDDSWDDDYPEDTSHCIKE